MGFSLQEAQWLVKFYRNLPGQAPSGSPEMGNEEAEYMRPGYGVAVPMGPADIASEMRWGAMEMQADYSNYPSEEYYDEYW